VKFYTPFFKNSRVGKISRYDKAGEQASGRPAGSVMTVEFQLDGQEFVALNGDRIQILLKPSRSS
jgi:predicted 3-demethylubiquinone-9 3-methyltransferase (glyoxalase superfamily)